MQAVQAAHVYVRIKDPFWQVLASSGKFWQVLASLSLDLMIYGSVLVIAGMGDEAQSIDVFQELCDIYRRQGLLQDSPSGLFQTAQQQLGDLAELMHSYGFPTPTWVEEGRGSEPSSTADVTADQVDLPRCIVQHHQAGMSIACVAVYANGVAVQQNCSRTDTCKVTMHQTVQRHKHVAAAIDKRSSGREWLNYHGKLAIVTRETCMTGRGSFPLLSLLVRTNAHTAKTQAAKERMRQTRQTFTVKALTCKCRFSVLQRAILMALP